MSILLEYLKKYWKLVVLTLVLASINQVFSLLDPWILRIIIDDYATQYDKYSMNEFLSGVILLLLAAIGVAMVSRIAKNFQEYFVNKVTKRVGTDMYTAGIAHSLKLPYVEFEDQRSGETLGKIQKVRDDVEKFIALLVNVFFTTLVGFVFVMIYSVSIFWPIAPIYLATIPLLGFVSILLSKRIKKIQKIIVDKTTDLAGSTTESLRNIELVKSLGLAPQEIRRLNESTNKILDLELLKVKKLRSLNFIQGTLVNLVRTIITFILMYLIFTQKLTVGEYFSLLIYSFFIFGPLQQMGDVINTYRETEASLANYKGILSTPVEARPRHPKRVNSIKSISFDNVGFSHLSGRKNTLTDINFKAKKGDTLAFVGPSGAGKTTLVKLLVGLYTPRSGAVRVNGIKNSRIELDELRKEIGLVTQDTQLFSGTIKDNLLFVNPEATNGEIRRVLNQAACDSILERAGKGINTTIGENGIKVSGGEKQRLAIARALLRKPTLLVFDEATSALDSLTEKEISKTIRDISHTKDHVTIMIAHRLSTVMHADKIYVLENGRIIEDGKHEELLEEKGLYYAMWRQQVGRED